LGFVMKRAALMAGSSAIGYTANPAEILRAIARREAALAGLEVDEEAFDEAAHYLAAPADSCDNCGAVPRMGVDGTCPNCGVN
jgi:hypothetical protein